jgi:hypothetical protein
MSPVQAVLLALGLLAGGAAALMSAHGETD